MNDIVTKRLIIREWHESDSKDLYEYAKNELVGPNAGWKPHKDEEESKEIIEMFKKNKEAYAVVLKSENKVIGGVGLHNKKPDEKLSNLTQREIGYVLNPQYWGNGYIPEAVEALKSYGFNYLQLDLIWCGHYDYNNKSKRVVEKCGFNYKFQRTETLPLLDNKQVNVLYYSISKDEYMKQKNISM